MLLGTGHVVVGLLLLPGWLIVDLDRANRTLHLH